MAYGLQIKSPTWPIPIEISSGWIPSTYIGDISWTVSYTGASSYAKTFNIPTGMKLFVMPSTQIADTGDSDGYPWLYSYGCDIAGNMVTIRKELYSGGANDSANGRPINFHVYGYYPATTDQPTYGVQFSNSGVSTMMDSDTICHVAKWKIEVDVGTTRGTLSYVTDIPASADTPLPFISDSGYNSLAVYMDVSNNKWRVNVQRWNPNCGYKGSTILNPACVSGTLRIILFGKYSGTESSYGFSLYTSTGQVAYSSSSPPLMLRRHLTWPDISWTSSTAGAYIKDNAGDQFTTEERALEPMIQAPQMGILRLTTRYHWLASLCISSSGRFTCGTNLYKLERNYFGADYGWWGPNFSGSLGSWIAGTDYF